MGMELALEAYRPVSSVKRLGVQRRRRVRALEREARASQPAIDVGREAALGAVCAEHVAGYVVGDEEHHVRKGGSE